MLIYVSGKYSAPTLEEKEYNTNLAIDAGIQVMLKGHEVIVPHLSHWLDLRAQSKGITLTWQDFMDTDIEIIKRCDAILYISSSKGADLELEEAKNWGLEVFYSIDEVPNVKLDK